MVFPINNHIVLFGLFHVGLLSDIFYDLGYLFSHTIQGCLIGTGVSLLFHQGVSSHSDNQH